MLNGGYYLCLLTIDFILNIYNHRSTINGLSMVSSSDPITTSVPSPRTSRCRHSHWPQRRALNRWPSGALSTGVCHGRWGGNIPWVCHGWPENWKISNGVYHVLPEICGKISGEELRTCFFSSKNIWKHMKTTKNPMVKSWEHNFSRLKCDKLGLYATLSNTCICNTLDVNGSIHVYTG